MRIHCGNGWEYRAVLTLRQNIVTKIRPVCSRCQYGDRKQEQQSSGRRQDRTKRFPFRTLCRVTYAPFFFTLPASKTNCRGIVHELKNTLRQWWVVLITLKVLQCFTEFCTDLCILHRPLVTLFTRVYMLVDA